MTWQPNLASRTAASHSRKPQTCGKWHLTLPRKRRAAAMRDASRGSTTSLLSRWKHKPLSKTFHKSPRLITADRTPLVLSRGRSPFSGDDMTALEDRFWAKVDKTEGCWNWTGYKNHSGYGLAKSRVAGKRTTTTAQRVSYELANGPILSGLVIDHLCHNHACVKPEHLRAVTNKQNSENTAGPSSNSKTGVQGVSWHAGAGKWRARVVHDGKGHYVGLFADVLEAERAVIAKRIELFTHNELDRVA